MCREHSRRQSREHARRQLTCRGDGGFVLDEAFANFKARNLSILNNFNDYEKDMDRRIG